MTRLLGTLDHDECASWCDHDPEHHTEDCGSSFCDSYDCWTAAATERPNFRPPKSVFDIRNEPSVTITDLYTRSGQHLRSTMSTEDGTIIEEWGPNTNKNVAFFNISARELWEKIPWPS